ncbi:hypothetical protein [Ascidiaceihabitans sp.]|uniref:hypothetical protein n=1 Tax=Ascidiaceihabitans sp. TaxID=1872644 RepID=UPI00329A1774
MHNKGRGGWMGDRMIFSLVPKDVTGFVYDGVIKNAYDSPIAARVTKRKDTLWRYKWDVEGAASVNAGKLSLTYSALLNTKSGKVTVNGILHGGDNVVSGEGRCKVVK